MPQSIILIMVQSMIFYKGGAVSITYFLKQYFCINAWIIWQNKRWMSPSRIECTLLVSKLSLCLGENHGPSTIELAHFLILSMKINFTLDNPDHLGIGEKQFHTPPIDNHIQVFI